MKKIILIITSLLVVANIAQAARCKASVSKLVQDLSNLGGDVSQINLSRMVSVEDIDPVLDQVTDIFVMEAFVMDSGIVNGLYTQEQLDNYAQNQYQTLSNAFDRHERECGVLYEGIKKAIREGVQRTNNVITRLEFNQVSRLEAAQEIDRIAQEETAQAIRDRDAEKSRRASYNGCLQEHQESQCKKKYGY